LKAEFSKIRNEIYVVGDTSIKIWNAQSGKPVRVLKNIFTSSITYIRLDDTHRQIVVGSHNGEIKVYDVLSGLMTHQLEGHSKD
jgi:WD40 repeat protein